MKCPECQSKAELRARQHTYPVSTVYTLIGITLPFLYSYSRKRKYYCSQCESSFFKLPVRSALVRPVFWLHMAFPIVMAIALFVFLAYMAIVAP